MSDDEYEYEYDSDASMDDANDNDQNDDVDEDEEDFVYTDEEDNDPHQLDNFDAAIDNEYYNAKDLREDEDVSHKKAIEKFENVITMEEENSEDIGNCIKWTFKALKQMMKLRLRYEEYDDAKKVYERLLEVVSNPENTGVSPNDLEKGVTNMLERVSSILYHDRKKKRDAAGAAGSMNRDDAMHVDESVDGTDTSSNSPQNLAWFVWDATLGLFHPQTGACPNARQWFSTNLKYGQLLYENHQTSKLQNVIHQLLRNNTTNNNNNTSNNVSTSSTNLMEIYALQIQLYSRMKDHKKLREIYSKAMKVQGGIPHPRTIGLIQELGGKMHMSSREYELANTAFFQAFKSYDEAGDNARLRCLKYLVLASMLHASSINPFDSQEVRPYKEDPEIVAMTRLVDAFHSNDIETFDKILKRNEGRIMDDEFIREYIADLLWTIRMQVLIEVLRPYTRITIGAISKKLNDIPLKEAENLLVTAILDGKLDGRIDQVNGVLLKNKDTVGGSGGGNGSSSDGNLESTSSGSNTQGVGDGMNSSSSGGMKSGSIMDCGDDGTSTLPIWGENSISVKTCTAMENLMNQLESVTLAVTSMNTKASSQQIYSYLKSS